MPFLTPRRETQPITVTGRRSPRLGNRRYSCAVTISETLRRLGERVLRKPKTASGYRNHFIVGLVGTLIILATVAVTGDWRYITAVGGFVGMMIGGGVWWYEGHDLRGGR